MVTTNSEENYIIANVIADFLEEKNIEVVFGIIGSANAYIFDAISTKGYTKVVYMHHEQACVMAAGSYYRTNGKISVAIVTAGAGSSNAITGLLCNWADSIPCIVISGQESTHSMKNHTNLRMRGVQGFPVVDMIQGMVKYTKLLDKPEEVLETLEKSYFIALDERPGPVWVDIPMDIQSSKIVKKELSRYIPPNKIYNEYDITQIISLLKQSVRPVIMAGHGIKLSHSEEEFKKLVNILNIPILLTWSGIDILPENHPYNFGCSGIYGQRCANFIVQNCDLLFVFGSRLALPQTGYDINAFAPNAKIIIVNNDIHELNKYARYDIKINVDCKRVINDLLISEVSLNTTTWHNRCLQYKKDFPIIEECHLLDNKKYDNSYILIHNLSNQLKEDHVIVIGQGTPLPCCHQALKIKSKQTVFASNGLGEMGNGLPSAIGAALAADTREIILLDGDGSMMMNLQELQTIVGYNLPVKIIIFNNEGYLFIKHTQKMLFNGRYAGVNKDTGVSLPEFKKIAYAFGIPYFNSKHHNISEFLNHTGYAIFECYMNPEQDLVPKVKGISTSNGIIPVTLEEMSPLIDIQLIEKNMIVNVNKLSYRIRNEFNSTNNTIDNNI
jgi:acetolactate synthase-1/2/3 large subunit